MSVKVSIILTAFNSESTIEDAVRAILNQTYTNFEYNLKDIKDPLPHPIEVKDKTLIMDVKKNYLSLFFRKVSPTVTVEYQEL